MENENQKKLIYSAIQPSGMLTLGNYLGALRNLSLIHISVGSVCYECGDALFTGDTLFRLGVGRTDLPTGNTAKMIESLKKLYEIKGDFEVFPGHGKPSTLSLIHIYHRRT